MIELLKGAWRNNWAYFGCRDYRPMPQQDRYDPEMLDDGEDMSELSFGARMDAEIEMRQRDRAEGRGRGMRRGLLYGELKVLLDLIRFIIWILR
jgi:hypothetical protein